MQLLCPDTLFKLNYQFGIQPYTNSWLRSWQVKEAHYKAHPVYMWECCSKDRKKSPRKNLDRTESPTIRCP